MACWVDVLGEATAVMMAAPVALGAGLVGPELVASRQAYRGGAGMLVVAVTVVKEASRAMEAAGAMHTRGG